MDRQTVPKHTPRINRTHEEELERIRIRDRALRAKRRAEALESMTPDERALSLRRARRVVTGEDGKRRVAKTLTDAWCARCFVMFTPKRRDRVTFCSRECAHLHQGQSRRDRGLPKAAWGSVDGNHRRRAKAFGCEYVPFDPMSIFERDGWKCQECGRHTPRQSRGQILDDAPTLDHIVPLSKRGPHTPDNTRCLCLPCNLKKGAHGPS